MNDQHTATDTQLVPLDNGAMHAAPQFVEPLRRSGLDRVGAVMETTRGRRLRALATRENWRIEIDLPHEGPRGAYLKKHHESNRSTSWSRLISGEEPSPGAVEALNVHRLWQDGIAAMQLVAYGERHHAGVRESFVITEELAGYEQLDHFIRRRFALLVEQNADEKRSLRNLIAAVASVARRFHERGYNHRDLYCCHFFIREQSSDCNAHDSNAFDVRLIDLQRVEQRRWFRRRWVIKDLAQLAYSTPRERISSTAQMRFIKHYLGCKRLRPADKRLIRAVLSKRDAMIRKLGPHP